MTRTEAFLIVVAICCLALTLFSRPAFGAASDIYYVDGGSTSPHFSTLCAALSAANAASVHLIIDTFPENGLTAWAVDPFSSPSCGNGYAGYTLFMGNGTWETEKPIVQPFGVHVMGSGRGTETQVNLSNQQAGTLIVACSTQAPWTGSFKEPLKTSPIHRGSGRV